MKEAKKPMHAIRVVKKRKKDQRSKNRHTFKNRKKDFKKTETINVA